jgi:hypothetical protein
MMSSEGMGMQAEFNAHQRDDAGISAGVDDVGDELKTSRARILSVMSLPSI